VSDEQDDDKTGYGKPPKYTRWKPGQSGNSKRQHPKRAHNAVELIDRLLLKQIEITVGGKLQKVTTLEAILFQLWKKEINGDTRALKIRLKYLEFARQHIRPRTETVFVDNEYTKALAGVPLLEDKDKKDE
jgi:hypothetical protein